MDTENKWGNSDLGRWPESMQRIVKKEPPPQNGFLNVCLFWIIMTQVVALVYIFLFM